MKKLFIILLSFCTLQLAAQNIPNGKVTRLFNSGSTAYIGLSDSAGFYRWFSSSGLRVAYWDISSLTAARTYTLPNVSGTLITTGNLSSVTTVGTVTAGTWNGTVIGSAYGGVPSGGTTGQVLKKNSNTSYDYSWTNESGGGMSNPMTTLGDIIYGGASGTPTRLGSSAGFLKSTGASAPAWSSIGVSDVNSGTWTGRVNPRVQTVSSSSTVTPNADNDDIVIITAQATTLMLANPSGTPVQGQVLIVRMKDNGTQRDINYGTAYRGVGNILAVGTQPSKTIYQCFIYNSTDSKWDCISVNVEQ